MTLTPHWRPRNITFDESLTTNKLSKEEAEKIQRASKIANPFAHWNLTPTGLDNMSFPLLLQRTPPLPSYLGLPLAAPSTLNFKTPSNGGTQGADLFSLCIPHIIQASQLHMISFNLMLQNYFIMKVHFATLKPITNIWAWVEDEVPLKILLFNSIQTWSKNAKK